MGGRRQDERLVRYFEQHPSEIPEGRFRDRDRGHRIECVLDGSNGLHGITHTPTPEEHDFTGRIWRWSRYFPWAPWQIPHLLPHPYRCWCGKAWPTRRTLLLHVNRTNWPDRVEHHGVVPPVADPAIPWIPPLRARPRATRPGTID